MAVSIDKEKCVACGSCVEQCPVGALKVVEDCIAVDEGSCAECGVCTDACPTGVLSL